MTGWRQWYEDIDGPVATGPYQGRLVRQKLAVVVRAGRGPFANGPRCAGHMHPGAVTDSHGQGKAGCLAQVCRSIPDYPHHGAF
jgi:hypothetical protein